MRTSESGISNQTIVLAVTADPIPHDSIFVHDGQGTVLQTDANRVDVVFAFQFFRIADRDVPDWFERDSMSA
jgi:hypothetical protein